MNKITVELTLEEMKAIRTALMNHVHANDAVEFFGSEERADAARMALAKIHVPYQKRSTGIYLHEGNH